MASQGALLFKVFLLFAAIFPMTIQAKDYVVGDDKGWTTRVDYQAWAKGKEFRVGDKLIFNYPAGAHNVFKVNGSAAFQSCTKPPLKEALTSGHDTIVLATTGKKWYICGVAQHCATGGQKLAIDVQPQWLAPSPAPWASRSKWASAPWSRPSKWAPPPGSSRSEVASAPWAAQKRPFMRFFRW